MIIIVMTGAFCLNQPRDFQHMKSSKPLSKNVHLIRWVNKMAALCKPDMIHWVDGSQKEYDALCAQMAAGGTFTRLNPKKWPGCYLARSDASDVARVEDRTFICSLSKGAAGPTNHWVDPFAMRKTLRGLFDGCMRGRKMYVLPFSMGPIGSPMSQIGLQLTDSPYVVVNMRIMARIGKRVFELIDRDFRRVVPCMHSVGAPLAKGQKDVPWPCNRENISFIFPRHGKSGATVPVTAATRCWGKNASHCGSPARWHATRAGWRNTCSFSGWRIRKARRRM